VSLLTIRGMEAVASEPADHRRHGGGRYGVTVRFSSCEFSEIAMPSD